MKMVLQCLNAAVLCLLAVVLGAELVPQNWPGARLVESAQGQDVGAGKMVLVNAKDIRTPARVIKIMENGQPVFPGWLRTPEVSGRRFAAGEDWLSNLSFVVKNRTSLRIAYICMGVVFPEDQSYDQYLQFGRMPAATAAAYFHKPVAESQARGKSLDLGPGQEMHISLYGYVDSIKAAKYTKVPFSNLTKCALTVLLVFFDDQDLIWEWGHGYTRLDPESPNGLRRLVLYFPGDLIQAQRDDAVDLPEY